MFKVDAHPPRVAAINPIAPSLIGIGSRFSSPRQVTLIQGRRLRSIYGSILAKSCPLKRSCARPQYGALDRPGGGDPAGSRGAPSGAFPAIALLKGPCKVAPSFAGALIHSWLVTRSI